MADDWTAPAQRANGEVVTHTIWNEQVMDNLTALKAASEGDAQATGEVLHYHKVGTLAAKPAPGNAGRTYFASDLGLWLVDDGTSWHPYGPVGSLCEWFHDDAIFDYDTGASETHGPWAVALGADATITTPTGENGAFRLLSTTANEPAILRSRASDTGDFYGLARLPALLVFKIKHNDPALASQGVYIGLKKSFPVGAVDPTDGIYIRKEGNGNFFGVTRKNDAEEATDLGTTAAALTTFYIEILATNSVKFYVDTYDAAADASHTTNEPDDEDLNIGMKLISTNATEKTLDYYSMDWYSARA